MVVSKRGAKPLGACCAQIRVATGMSWMYGNSTMVRASCAPRWAINSRTRLSNTCRAEVA